MRVLLAIEGNEDGKLIADFAMNFCWPPGCKFGIVHVLASSKDDESAEAAYAEAEKLVENFQKLLMQYIPDANWTTMVLSGSPTLELVQLVSSWRADMIVLGYRNRLVMPPSTSVSRAVGLEVPCSVAIIRPPVSVLEGQRMDYERAESINA